MASGVSSSSYDDFHSSLTSLALSATRSAAVLPNERDLNYHKSLDPEFSQNVDQTSQRILGLTNKILSFVDKKGKGKEKLRADDVVDNFGQSVVDVVDVLLEGTDTALDVVLGRIKEPAIYVNPNAPQVRKTRLQPKASTSSGDVPKPQLRFLKRTKTWSHAPAVKISYPDAIFKPCEPIAPRPLNETPFTVVSTLAQYRAMVSKLRLAKEIAVDLEHHDYRSYTGILCLMQISTREEDFVVDLLDPEIRLEIGDGEDLRNIFQDPSVTKVFHGAEHDVFWLHRDFDIHIVNLFDTYHASKVLEFPSHSLSSLMQLYCSITPDKQYQLSDWRVRPLPPALLDYARSDTHYLLYIFDHLRNALLDRGRISSPANSREGSPASVSSSSSSSSSTRRKNKKTTRYLRDVLTRSHTTATKPHIEKPNDSGANLAKKWNKPLWAIGSLNEEGLSLTKVVRMQKEVYVALFRWRENVAKGEDESVRYVMPNHHLFQLAEHPPATMADLLRAFGGSGPSVIVRKRAEELLGVIKEAVVRGLEESADQVTPAVQAEKEQVELIAGPSTSSDDQSRLWNFKTVLSSSDAVESSILLGPKRNTKLVSELTGASPVSTNIRTSSSALFPAGGKGKAKAVQQDDKMIVDQTDFQTIVSRIHSSLVVLPQAAVPKNVPAHSVDELKDTGVPGMHVEIPYVPASERTTIPSKTVPTTTAIATTSSSVPFAADDGVVQVGISSNNRNKRKRKFPSSAGAGGEIETFDFGSVPNILDTVGAKDADEGGNAKKRKKEAKGKGKRGGGGIDTSAFPKPPKGRSEQKGGNISGSFR